MVKVPFESGDAGVNRPPLIKRSRKALFIGGLLLAVLGISYALIVWRAARLSSEAPQPDVQQEFSSFVPPPQAVSLQKNDISNLFGTYVGEYYTTSLSFEDVRKHYEKQLIDKGYTFRDVESLQSWGKDYGEQVVHYCKGSRMAALYNPGTVPMKEKYQFSFSLNTNVSECK